MIGKSFQYFWGAVLLLLPFYIRVEPQLVDMRFSKDMLFVFCVFVSLLLFGLKRIRHYKTTFAYFVIMAFANQGFIGSQEVVMEWIYFMAGILLLGQFLTKRLDWEFWLNTLSIAAILQAIVFYFNWCNIDPYDVFMQIVYGSQVTRRAMETGYVNYSYFKTGSLGNPTVSANFMALCAVTLLRKKWCWFIPVILGALYYSSSASSMGLFIFALLFYIWLFTPYKLITSGGFTLSFIPFYFLKLEKIEYFSDNGRFGPWKSAVMWIKWPRNIVGRGLGYVSDNFGALWPTYKHIHNEYLDIYVAFGLLGLGFFFYLAYTLLAKCKNKLQLVLAVSSLILLIPSFSLHITSISLVYIVIFSLIVNDRGENNGLDSNIHRTLHTW